MTGNNQSLIEYLEKEYKGGRSHGFIIKYITADHPQKAVFEYMSSPLIDGFYYVQIKFSLDNKEYLFNIPCDDVSCFNDLISVSNIDKKIILELISRYVSQAIDNSEINKINWDDFVPKLEYDDFVFIINNCKDITDKIYICSKVPDSNLSFFSKLWLLFFFKYYYEAVLLIGNSVFDIKNNAVPSRSGETAENSPDIHNNDNKQGPGDSTSLNPTP